MTTASHTTEIEQVDARVTELLDELSFSKHSAHNGCRDQVAASVRVHQQPSDECCHIYGFVPGLMRRGILEYEIRLSYGTPFSIIRATIEAAVNRAAPLGRR